MAPARGDLGAAASSNLLLVAAIPVLVAAWVRTMTDRWRRVTRVADPRRTVWLAVASLVLAVAFAVLRNTGAGAWLAP